MIIQKITDAISYTGVFNPNMRVFDVIMRTDCGTSYNSYAVRGSEKCALIEAAHHDFMECYAANIAEALDGRKPDYLVLNHCEPDHTGCIADLLELYPDLTIVVSQAGAIYIKNITNRPDIKIQVVKDGESISLGDKTLQFINAPFLHWPDSMFTYVPEEKVLFSCDFFGVHYCEPMVLDTKVAYEDRYWEAAKYYYDCIFGPFQSYVRKGLEKIKDLEIQVACNSHGPVLTKGGKLDAMLEKYIQWSTPEPKSAKLIPVFYCTAYGNTEKLAQAAVRGIKKVLPDAECTAYNIIDHDMDMLTGLMNESDAFLVGSPTINRDAVPPVWQLLSGIEAVNIQKRPVALFGSYGWSGEAVPHIAERLASVKCNVFDQQVRVTFVPTANDEQTAEEMGEAFAKTLA